MNPNRDEFMGRYGNTINPNNQDFFSDKSQLDRLNKCVINACVNAIKNEVIAYLKYREDISTMAIPQDLPILSNTKNKTLELKPWF